MDRGSGGPDRGRRPHGVTDSRGGVYDANGFDPKAAFQHKQSTGGVSGFNGLQAITNDEVLELDVDVLIPAAIENVITDKNAARWKM